MIRMLPRLSYLINWFFLFLCFIRVFPHFWQLFKDLFRELFIQFTTWILMIFFIFAISFVYWIIHLLLHECHRHQMISHYVVLHKYLTNIPWTINDVEDELFTQLVTIENLFPLMFFNSWNFPTWWNQLTLYVFFYSSFT